MTWVCTSCGHRNLGRFKECQQCGNPKDASERFEMPGDTAAAASVHDPRLLQQARAGADWRCTYCGTDYRALVVACVQCGSPRGTTPTVKQLAGAYAPSEPRQRPRWALPFGAGILALAILLPAFGVFAALVTVAIGRSAPPPPVAAPDRPRIVGATVIAREWRTTLRTERRRAVAHEGFAESRPADAFDIEGAGERHHHDEQVLDHYETEAYTEQVPYQDSETYTEQVRCGEDCHDLPESCSEHCSDDGNGFATCTTSCTGGGQSCSPRYCSETRTRSVTRYRSEPRTREVPRYRSEPRTAPWFTWRVWEWTPDRRAERTGNEDAPSWPDPSELGPAAPLGEGEEDREVRDAWWVVHVREDGKGREHLLTPPTIDALARYPVGATLSLETWWDGRFTEVAPPQPPVSGERPPEPQPPVPGSR